MELLFSESLHPCVPVEIYPTQPVIDKLYDADCPFPEGSLSMQAYLDEFKDALLQVRDSV